MQLEQLSGADIEKEMQDITEQIRDTKQEIDELVEENKSIAQQLSEYQQKDAKCRILIERYETLISQYKADLQRLDFIAKGEKAVQGMPSNNVCPFCGGDLHQEEDDSYMEAIHSCLKRIIIPIPQAVFVPERHLPMPFVHTDHQYGTVFHPALPAHF